jgi:histidinol dehydrogenase
MAIRIKQLSITNKQEYSEILRRAKLSLQDTIDKVKPIIESVEKNGDEALFRFTSRFDGVDLKNFVIEPNQKQITLSKDLESAFEMAYKNIYAFHTAQLKDTLEVQIAGNRLGVKYTPIDSLAVYAPGGKALYPSSILMGVIPARVAGVKTISLFTPPSKNGFNPALIYAAKLAGVDRIYTLGGAQAIAAAAFGTETVLPSEFVVGPGNQFVTAAKVYLSGLGVIGIESPAGPSEVLIIADETANAEWVACDMLSQAEHGEDSVAILTTNSLVFAEQVAKELDTALSKRKKRFEMKSAAIRDNSYILVFPTIAECIEFSNLYAPEHLEIITQDYRKDFENIKHAGSVFLGKYSPVAMGDYISGTNHILPTAGGSRIYSSLGVDTFLKRVTFQEITKPSLVDLYPHVKALSELEGLDEEHGTSVYLRTLE